MTFITELRVVGAKQMSQETQGQPSNIQELVQRLAFLLLGQQSEGGEPESCKRF